MLTAAPKTVSRLDALLRTVIDYPSVAKDVANYNHDSLATWVNHTKNWKTLVTNGRWKASFDVDTNASIAANNRGVRHGTPADHQVSQLASLASPCQLKQRHRVQGTLPRPWRTWCFHNSIRRRACVSACMCVYRYFWKSHPRPWTLVPLLRRDLHSRASLVHPKRPLLGHCHHCSGLHCVH